MRLKTTFIALCFALISNSQTKIMGKVYDEEGPLSGANISIKHSNRGTISDVDGYFELQAKSTDTVAVSYLGYDTKEVLVGNRKEITIALEGSIALDEVIIQAYGTNRTRCVISCILLATECEAHSKEEEFESINQVQSDSNSSKLFPNPSRTGHFNLRLSKDYKTVDLQCHDISGRLVKSLKMMPVERMLNIKLTGLPTGIYIINISANGKRIVAKKAIIH